MCLAIFLDHIMDYFVFVSDDGFLDVVTWPPADLMGNTCTCLGGGRDYPVVRGPQLGDNGEIDVSPSGSYRKTAAKYKVPTPASGRSPTDVNKNKATKPEVESGIEKHESEESEKMMNSTDSAKSATHVQTFLAPSITDNMLDVTTPAAAPSGKTHVEVFSLSVAAEEESPKSTASANGSQPAPTESGHINFSDYLKDDKSPTSSPSKSSPSATERTATEGGESSPNNATSAQPDITNESQEPVLVIDFKNYQLPAQSDHTFVLEQSSVSTTSHRSKSLSPPKTGIANEAFDISDEQEPSSPAAATNEPGSPPDKVLPEGDDSDTEVPDERHFFFGMESLKFESVRHKTGAEYEGEEADREVAEIMLALHTIEDRIWTTLKPPEDETDSAKLRLEAQGSNVTLGQEDGVVYGDVMRHLSDMCNKVEDILRRKGILSNQFDDDWLNLPELSSSNMHYCKKTVSLQTETVNSLITAKERCDDNQLQEILDDYKRKQERLLRKRETERRKLAERLRDKIGGRKGKLPASGDEQVDGQGDSDTEELQNQYAVVMNQTWTRGDGDGCVTPDDISSDECSSDSISSEDLGLLTEADLAATVTLKATLTSDIQARMTDMTSDDFQSIMGLYRKERRSIRDIRDSERDKLSQSLWEKLADRRRHNQEGELLEEVESEKEPEIGSVRSTHAGGISVGVDTSVTTKDSETDPQSRHTQDATTETEDDDRDVIEALDKCLGVTTEDLAQLNTSVLSRTPADAVLSSDEADRLLKEHFLAVRKLKEQKEQEAETHRQRALERLRQRRQENELDESQDTDIEPSAVTVQADDSIEEQCLHRIKQKETVSQEDLQSVLDSYRQQQQALMDNRIHQRAALNERLRDKLRAAADKRRQLMEDSRQAEEENNPENQIRSMDDAFYQSLLVRKQEGDLSPDQLARLIDEHLDLVDEFKKEVKDHMAKRREERRRQADAEQASALVEENKQTRAHVRALRQQERAKTDVRLAEKLQRKKQKRLKEGNGKGTAVPKKPERKRISSRVPTPSQSNYGQE